MKAAEKETISKKLILLTKRYYQKVNSINLKLILQESTINFKLIPTPATINLKLIGTPPKTSNNAVSQPPKDNKIKNNSSSSKEEEIIKNEDKKLKHILRRIDKLWSGYAIQVGTLKYSDVEEIEQYSLEAIDECFGAAEEAAIRKGNTDWLLNRLRYPDRYGVKISKPKPTEREKAVNQCKTVVNIYRNQQDENTKYMTVKTLQEWFEKFGAEFGAEIDMKLEEFEELQRSTK